MFEIVLTENYSEFKINYFMLKKHYYTDRKYRHYNIKGHVVNLKEY